jgi:hypothetical protein
MAGTRDHHIEQGKLNSERQILYLSSHMQNLGLKSDNNNKNLP